MARRSWSAFYNFSVYTVARGLITPSPLEPWKRRAVLMLGIHNPPIHPPCQVRRWRPQRLAQGHTARRLAGPPPPCHIQGIPIFQICSRGKDGSSRPPKAQGPGFLPRVQRCLLRLFVLDLSSCLLCAIFCQPAFSSREAS